MSDATTIEWTDATWNPTTVRHPDPVGPDNDAWIRAAALTATVAILAWGAHPAATPARERAVLGVLDEFLDPSEVLCLGTTSSGSPRHPLYLRADIEPTRYAP